MIMLESVYATWKVKWYKPASPTTTSDWPDGLQAQSASGRSTRMAALMPAVAGSQIRTVPSSPAVASQVPSGAIATALTESVWPVRVARCWPVAGSQIRTDPSRPAVASQVPSGAIATAHVAVVAGEGGALPAGGRVPDPHRPVAAGGGEPGPSGAIATALTGRGRCGR